MNTNTFKAFLFDLNGTMIDDMAYHNAAWYKILTEKLHLSISYEEVKRQMYGKNEELLIRLFGPGHFSSEQMEEISQEKEELYQAAFRPHLKLIPGLFEFLEQAHAQGILMAIGSAAIPFNIDFILDNLQIRHFFNAVVSAKDVLNSKPDPETFLKCAAQLGVSPDNCLVFEDVPKGVQSAQAAGMRSVVITTTHHADEFVNFQQNLGFISDYRDPKLLEIIKV